MAPAIRTLPQPRRVVPVQPFASRRWTACLAASTALHGLAALFLAWALAPAIPRGPRRVRGPVPRVVFELAVDAPSVPWSDTPEALPPVQPVEPAVEPELVECEFLPEMRSDEPAPPGPSLRPLLEPEPLLAELPARFVRPPIGAIARVEPPSREPMQFDPLAPQPPPEAGAEEPAAEPAPAGEGGDEEPVLEHAPPPAYPQLALRLRLAGSVLLRIRVSQEGRVLAASVERSSGHALLDEAALDAVRSWRFRPGTRDGQPVTREVLAPVIFRLP